MSTSVFPTSLDAPSNPVSTNMLNMPTHAAQHSLENDAIVAIETKVGINGSAVNTTVDYKLAGITTGDKAVSKTGIETLTNKTLTSPVLNTPSFSAGAINTADLNPANINLTTIALPVSFSSWTPSFTGFSANPTVTAFYLQIGKMVYAHLETVSAGTSNATTKTVTLPVATKRSFSYQALTVKDNGSIKTTPGSIFTTATSATASVFVDTGQSTGWTSSGSCFFTFDICYEAN